jgi:hypothetical protein
MEYAEYSTLIDSGLVLLLAVIVWVAYRELRRRKRDDAPTSNSPVSNSPAA